MVGIASCIFCDEIKRFFSAHFYFYPSGPVKHINPKVDIVDDSKELDETRGFKNCIELDCSVQTVFLLVDNDVRTTFPVSTLCKGHI